MDDWTLDLCCSAVLTELHPWAHGYKKETAIKISNLIFSTSIQHTVRLPCSRDFIKWLQLTINAVKL